VIDIEIVKLRYRDQKTRSCQTTATGQVSEPWGHNTADLQSEVKQNVDTNNIPLKRMAGVC